VLSLRRHRLLRAWPRGLTEALANSTGVLACPAYDRDEPVSSPAAGLIHPDGAAVAAPALADLDADLPREGGHPCSGWLIWMR